MVMTQKAAKAFFDKIKTDDNFRKKVMAAEDDAKRIKLIKAEGFDCTMEEINAYERQLSDKYSDKICGGQFGETSFIFGALKNILKNKLFL
jgi:predicted ribosomally synthesized peptide with nif11-like leader